MGHASTPDLRRHNRRRVLEFVRAHEPLSRVTLARKTGLTKPAISRIARELIEVGLIDEAPRGETGGKPGRPIAALSLHSSGAYVLGFEIGAIDRWISLCDLRGGTIARTELHLSSLGDPQQALSEAATTAERLIAGAGVSRGRVLGAGVAIAGIVDRDNATVIDSPNLGWRMVHVADVLSERLRIPVTVESRPNALLMAEHRNGVARDCSDVALVLVALGIGGALMFDRQLAHGRRNAAGQIGHLAMPGADALCTCGRRGCLDTLASGSAVLTRLGIRAAREAPESHRLEDAVRLRQVIAAAVDGDQPARRAFRDAGAELGRALNSLVALTDPAMVVLAGALAQVADFADGVDTTFQSRGTIPVVPTHSTIDAAAAQLALQRFVFSTNLDFSRLRDAEAPVGRAHARG